MAFFIKNFESITASLIINISESTTALTDFNVGSKTRVMIEAFAEELEAFYHMMFRGILEATNDAVFNSFDFPALPAVAASGNVTFSLVVAGSATPLAPTTTFTIPRGFRVQIPVSSTLAVSSAALPGTIYTVTTSTAWAAGQTSVVVPVACTQAGTIGNTTANSITGIVDILPTVTGGQFKVTNVLPFVNGEPAEDQNSRKARFAQYLQSLGKGTLVAIEHAALTAQVLDASGNVQEQVKTVFAVEPFKIDGSLPVGHVDVYIYNGFGNTSAALVAATQQIVDGYVDSNGNKIAGFKAAGIIATVKAAIEQPQTFQINVKMQPNTSLTDDIISQIQGAIVKYVSTLGPGDTLIFNRIIELVMDSSSVYNCVIVSPNGDVQALDVQHIITVGSVSVTEDSNLGVVGETFNL